MAVSNLTQLRIGVKWRFAGKSDIVNVIDAIVQDAAGVIPTADVLAGVEEYVTAIYLGSGYVGTCSTSLVHQEISVFDRTAVAPVGYVAPQASLNGPLADEVIPLSLTPLILMRTSVSRVVGKKYLPPPTITTLDAGQWSSAFQDVMAELCEVLLVPYETTLDFSLQYVVDRGSPATYALPTSYAVRAEPAVQTRRKPGIGS